MRLGLISFLWLSLCVSISAASSVRVDSERIQRIADDFRARLSIPHAVNVVVVERNPLMASVARDPETAGAFVLSFEEGFVAQLTDDELKAAVAHELGHVWIFTHFPYLQTEQLANEIAMRVVTRESLEPLYAQLLQRDRVNGDLSKYLGESR